MESPSALTTRRQFLERSAWGFGSAFLLPSLLLQSCTDHIIPDPSNPVDPPLPGDANIDWNNLTKVAVVQGLSYIPGAGSLIGTIIGLVWPSDTTTQWDTVRSQVQAFVKEELADEVFNTATGKLSDLRSVIKNYRTAITNQGDILGEWEIAVGIMESNLSTFQLEGSEIMLLPLFAQYVNMYLALLRDALIPADGNIITIPPTVNGKVWGMVSGDITSNQQKLQDQQGTFVTYVNKWYNKGRGDILTKITRDDEQVEPFRSVNAYDRQMTMLVLDYFDTWPKYSPQLYPNGLINPDGTKILLFNREIYSDPIGNRSAIRYTDPPFALPSPATQFFTQLTVWSGERIDAVQLTYPTGGGPKGATTTPRMGDSGGGSPHTFDIAPNGLITKVVVTYDYSLGGPTQGPVNPLNIHSLQFTFVDGTATGTMGKPGKYNPGDIGYDNYALSSIYIDGTDQQVGNANCIVFGFKRLPS